MEVFLVGGPTAGNTAYLWKKNEPKDVMELFLAGLSQEKNRANAEGDFMQSISVLESFYYYDEWMDVYIKEGHWHFMLDSGAFTFLKSGDTANIDWHEYTERYAACINRLNLDLFIELDIDNVVGLQKVEELRKLLIRLTNKLPIPVWHFSRGREYWTRMCDEFPYVALGGMAANPGYKRKLEPMFPYFLNEAHKRGTKVHGLGYTSVPGLVKYKFDSVDSTTWLAGSKGGYAWRFDGRSMIQQRPEGTARAKSKELAINNFREWVKFQRYAKVYL